MAYLTGDKRLLDKLNQLKKTDAKAAIRKGTRAGAKIVQARAKQSAPIRTGTLRQSIKVRALPRSRKWTGTMARAQVFYGAFLEYGTKHIKARHYMRQATDDTKQQAMTVALDMIRDEVERRLLG